MEKTYTLGAYPTIELLKHRLPYLSHVYLSSRVSPEIVDIIRHYTSEYSTNDSKVYRLSKAENVFVAGEFNRYETVLDSSANHLVLDQVADMGNLGTIIRTMVGFNFINLAVIRPAADIFHTKTIRASMGALFQINFQYFDSFEQYRLAFPRNFYPFISDAGLRLQSAHFQPVYSLIFGNESAGLPEFYQHIGTPVRIEQTDKIDSLNLSIAVSLGLYHSYIGNQ